MRKRTRSNLGRRAATVCLAVTTLALRLYAQPADPNEGSLAASKPRIPEPMVFDLVRPLGAERGELEINSLFEQPLSGGDSSLAWAPEAEITIARGVGIEFELPFEGARLKDYKFAFQHTLGKSFSKSMIHGWQSIARIDVDDGSINADLLYLVGAQLTSRWSWLAMNGVRRETTGAEQGLALVSNASLFFNRTKHVVFGIESNLKVGGPLGDSWLLMPQAHMRLVDHVNLQLGVGGEQRFEGGAASVASWRLIREF